MYPVDKSRINEFGFSAESDAEGEEDVEVDEEVEEGVKEESGEGEPIPKSSEAKKEE